MPQNAVQGGYDIDEEPLYIGRIKHESAITPGKVRKTQKLRSYNCVFWSLFNKFTSRSMPMLVFVISHLVEKNIQEMNMKSFAELKEHGFSVH